MDINAIVRRSGGNTQVIYDLMTAAAHGLEQST